MSVPSQFRSSAVILFSGNFVETIVAFGAQVVIARYLFPEDYGRFAITLANTSLVFLFLSLRVSTLIIRRPEAELTREVRERYFFVFSLETIVGAVATLLIVHWFHPLTLLDVTLITAIAMGHWVETNRVFYERSMNYRRIVAIEVGSKLIAHAVAVALVVTGAGVLVLYLREFIVASLRLVGFRLTGSLTIERLRWLPWREWRLVLAESRALWADGVLEGSFNRIVILLSATLGGAHGAGLFFFAHRLALVPQQFLMPIAGRLSGNWLSRQEDKALRRSSFSRLAGILFLFSAVMAVAAIAFADPVIPWLFGEAWRNSVPVFIALSGLILFGLLFEAVKVYCYVEGAGTAMLASRLGMFVVLAMVSGTLYRIGVGPAESMGFGVSAAFATAVCIGWFLLRHRAGRNGHG